MTEKLEHTITRADIVDAIVRDIGLTRQDSSAFLERVLELVCQELVEDRSVKLARFGNFVVRRKNARVGRNPRPVRRRLSRRAAWSRFAHRRSCGNASKPR